MVSAVLIVLGGAVALVGYVLFSLLQARLGSGGKGIKSLKVTRNNQESEGAKALRDLYEFGDPFERTKRVLILYGTEYGFSKDVARKVAEELAQKLPEVCPRIMNMLHYRFLDLSKEQACLICCSTTGDGVIPTDAKELYDSLEVLQRGSVSKLMYSVLALGDRSYPHFCRGGHLFNQVFESITGKESLVDIKEIDQEDWDDVNEWIEGVCAKIETVSLEEDESEDYLGPALEEGLKNSFDTHFSLSNPLAAPIKTKRLLTKVVSDGDKETVHVEFDIAGSGLKFVCGDALAVIGRNCPDEVGNLIAALDCEPEKMVLVPGTEEYNSVQEVFAGRVDLKTIKPDLVLAMIESLTSDADKETAKKLFGESIFSMDAHTLKSTSEFHQFTSDRFILDLVQSFPSAKLDPETIIQNSRALIPRFYSIASSPAKDDETISIAAAVVRYELHGLPRKGVVTTFLSDRCVVSSDVNLYVQTNNNFRLPYDDDTPILMMGAGTGIAPYISFLQERDIRRAKGENVLFFGCRHENLDFLYREELKEWEGTGQLDLHTAFSRDQEKKVYIQDRLVENASRVWNLMEAGAHLYVCGDASHMAEDVHQALLRIISLEGGKSAEEAQQYMAELEKKSRYQRDVWIS